MRVRDLSDADAYDPLEDDEDEQDTLAKEVEQHEIESVETMPRKWGKRGRPPKDWDKEEEVSQKRKYTRHAKPSIVRDAIGKAFDSERDNPMLPVAIVTDTIPIMDAIEIAQACRALESDAEVRPFLAGVRWAYDHLKKE